MPLYIVAFLIAACSLMAGAFGYGQGKEHTQSAWNIERAAQAEKLGLVMQAARAKETTAQVKVNAITKEKNAKILLLNDAYVHVADQLRKRPDRLDSPVSANAGTDLGCSGGTLPRQDAEFLASESARADRLRIQLEACRETYDEVRKSLASKLE